jgi:hypothetical protein
VAITAIDAELIRVDGVGKTNGLNRLIADAGVFGREVIRHAERGHSPNEGRAEDDLQRQPIGPLWKNIRHGSANGAKKRDNPRRKKLTGLTARPSCSLLLLIQPSRRISNSA